MSHQTTPEAEELIDRKFEILGQPDAYVRFVDYMGTDLRVAQAAWMDEVNSRGQNDEEAQRRVINQMTREGHTTPFEHVEFAFEMMLTIREDRQNARQRTAHWEHKNEYSQRYRHVTLPFHHYEASALMLQAKGGHGGRQDVPLESVDSGKARDLSERQRKVMQDAFELYEDMIAHGVAKEQARSHLPVATYTILAWKIDLHNLLAYLLKRLDSHAQEEIRNLSEPLLTCARAVAPLSVWAWEEYQRFGFTLSRTEVRELGIYRDAKGRVCLLPT